MISINYFSPDPLYRQIKEQIRILLKSGELKPGDSLPSIRSLSKQLDIAGNTAARAYQELETEGIIVTGGRRGSFIRADLNETGSRRYHALLETGIKGLISNGITAHEIMAEVSRIIAKEENHE